MKLYKNIGVAVPEIQLPQTEYCNEKWPVVACDQYTSEPQYWEQAAEIVGDDPSTLKLIFPEVYLEDDDANGRIENIHATMQDYTERQILKSEGECFVYVERRIKSSDKIRQGLVIAVDLECYDYRPGAETLIRATEGTIVERIPPRVKIRNGALLELPHIMMLIDDPQDLVFQQAKSFTTGQKAIYDVELMLDGGHVTGYKLDSNEATEAIADALEQLLDFETFNKKYALEGYKPFLFAMGDGNHSLATAKAAWEMVKKDLFDDELENHPARYALVELVNIHSAALEFEAIHRVLFGVNPAEVLLKMQTFFTVSGEPFEYAYFENSENPQEQLQKIRQQHASEHVVGFVGVDGFGYLILPKLHNLAIGVLQAFIDRLLEQNSEVKLDYIHGEAAVTDLGSRQGNMGFYLPSLAKGDLFKTVILDGVLPRKTFSMGEAPEKRYYFEARKIVK